MTDRELMQMALEALEELRFANAPFLDEAMEALRQALAQKGKECIYPECETGIGCDGPCGEKPVDTVKQEPVAWRWKERINDEFDSDWILTTYNPPPYAIQQEPLYAQPVDETAKRGHEPVAVWELEEDGWNTIADPDYIETLPVGTKLYTAPPKREWVGLTDEEILEAAGIDGADTWVFETAYAIEAKLKDKNT